MDRIIKAACLLFVMGQATIAGPLQDAAKSGDIELILRLLGEGADVNEAGQFGTALHWATMNGHVEAMEVLVQNGADLEIATDLLGTPLHAAVLRGQPNAASKLIALGANVNARKSDDATPLSAAAGGNRLEVAEILIAGGADVNAVVNVASGQIIGDTTALHIALRANYTDLAQILRDAGVGPFPIEPAATRLAGADPVRGLNAAQAWCAACHRIEADVDYAERLDHFGGPSLVGVYGRPVASVDGYSYSSELIAFGGTWGDDNLFAFASRPMLTVPGTRMSWHDGWSDEEVADIIAYFRKESE